MSRIFILFIFLFYGNGLTVVSAQSIPLDDIDIAWGEKKHARYVQFYEDLMIEDTNALVITFGMSGLVGTSAKPYLVYSSVARKVLYIIDMGGVHVTKKFSKRKFRKEYGKKARLTSKGGYGNRLTYHKTLDQDQEQSIISLMDTLFNHLLPIINRDSLNVEEKYNPETGEYKSLAWHRDFPGYQFSVYQGSKFVKWGTYAPCEAIKFNLDGIEHRRMLMKTYNYAFSILSTLHEKDNIHYFPAKCIE